MLQWLILNMSKYIRKKYIGRLQVPCEVAVCITVVAVEQLALQPTVTLKNANYNAPPQRGGPGPDSYI